MGLGRTAVLGIGNVGRHIVRSLDGVIEVDRKPQHRPLYLPADLHSPMDLLQIGRVDTIIWAAGMVSRVTCAQCPAAAVQSNIANLASVVQLANSWKAKLVYLSSSEVYGKSFYGWTKAAGEDVVKRICERWVIVRPFMIYGEDEDRGDHRSAFIRFADAIANDREIEVHKGARRSWLHVTDAAWLITQAAEEENIIVEIGHPDVRYMGELAHLLGVALKKSPKIKECEAPEDITLVKVPDLTWQNSAELFPAVSLEDGVQRVARWVSATG